MPPLVRPTAPTSQHSRVAALPGLLFGLALIVGLAGPAAAITYGQPDGDGHPNVGALVIDDPERGSRLICSGTLIAPAVFLTAGHCTARVEPITGAAQAWVTFDSVFHAETAKLISGSVVTHPRFAFPGAGGNFGDLHDVGVVLLDDDASLHYPGIEPAALPPAGLFGGAGDGRALHGQRFTAVGYGVQEPQIGGGPPEFPPPGERRVAVSTFRALLPAWLVLAQTAATGDGGTCFGDSGGPNFLGAGQAETDVIAALTSTGDAMCLATNMVYRLDTPSPRAFLSEFVDLP